MSLLNVAARLRAAGVDVRVTDLNTQTLNEFRSVVGANVIGPPYIHPVRQLIEQHKTIHPKGKFIVGGQGVSGFTDKQRHRLFGRATVYGNDVSALASTLAVPSASIPPMERVSIVGELEFLTDAEFLRYLKSEIPFYLSRGCRYSCTFCAAERTRKDPYTNHTLATHETYRELDQAQEELSYLAGRSAALDLSNLSIYLSNLDLFQSPHKLREFVKLATVIRNEQSGVRVSYRGLSTAKSFLDAHKRAPDMIREFVDAGLTRVGFGVDGATPDVWKAVRKPQKDNDCINAIAIAREVYDLTPEVLMVFGHRGHDDTESMSTAVDFTSWLIEAYRAVPRPHVAKDVVPGNDGWSSPENNWIVEHLLENSQNFQLLDFTCLPSWLTHSDPSFREEVQDAFLQICSMSGSSTEYIRPEDIRLKPDEFEKNKRHNLGRYDV